MLSYKKVIDIFQEASDSHIGITSFNTGTLDFLDSSSQNIKYPYIFLRPLSSPGIRDGYRRLTFEMYVLDVVRLDNESPVQIISRLERVGYDIATFFNNGPYQQEIDLTINNVTPVNEAFNDRCYGWMFNITVSSAGNLTNICNVPLS